MNTTNPSLAEFLDQVANAFRYLELEYGFVKQASTTVPNANPFQLRYENDTTAVVIEGVSWGTAAIASVGKKGARSGTSFELVPLWTLARLEGAADEVALQAPGQAAQIEASAEALPRLAKSALLGDFSTIDAARCYLEERVRKATQD
jgi:hypothetical protein